MKKYQYNINNLTCPNCARKLEEKLNQNKNLKNVRVNFTTKKISYETDSLTLKDINKIVSSIEPRVSISEDVSNKKEYHISLLLISIALFLSTIIFDLNNVIKETLIVTAYILLLYRPFINALKMLIKTKTINENMLITISCLGAYLIDEKFEGLMVVGLYVIGKILEARALNNSRRAISDIINIKQDYANLLVNDKVQELAVEQIKVNDILIVKKGEKIPVDAILIEGNTKIDSSALTGESDLLKVKENDKVLSGMINVGELIKIKATTLYHDSTVAKILDLVTNATDQKAKVETLVSRLSKIYTPIVLGLAILVTLVLPLFGLTFLESLYRGLTFLVISCPCAIAISVPLSYFTGIGVCSKKGILVKGSNYLDILNKTEIIVFDKTGTLTTGSFNVTDIKIFDKNYSKEDVIEILCKGESFSNHPIALSILKLGNEIDNRDVKNYKEIVGSGLSFELDDKQILIGNQNLCKCQEKASVHLNINGRHIASILIDDGIKKEAVSMIKYLKENSVKTVMFTGDKKENALAIAKKLEIDEIEAELLPADKYTKFQNLKKKNQIIAFVGDGINDAPVLKLADVGISMGEVGQSAAIEASDIVIMTDKLTKIVDAIKISKFTNKIIKQNLCFALLTKISILLLSVFGLTTMWFAVFADTGVTLLTIINTLRILRK